MKRIFSSGVFLGLICAALIVAATGLFTAADAHYRGYGYGPRHYAGYFAPGYLGPQFGPGYYEVTEFPTTYYDLPPYEEPAYGYGYRYGYGGGVGYCQARFASYNPYTGTYLGWDGYVHTCP